jgi:hypothetical protein
VRVGSLRRFFTPDPGVTLNPTTLGLRMSAWADRLRWPWNYAFYFAVVLALALVGIGAATSVPTHDPTWWRLGLVVGGSAACAKAVRRLRARGSLWTLDVATVRAEQQRSVASLPRPYIGVGILIAIVSPAIVGGKPVLAAFFGWFGGFLLAGAAISAVSAVRHRADLRAFTHEWHDVQTGSLDGRDMKPLG